MSEATRRVLVADDEPVTQLVLRAALEAGAEALLAEAQATAAKLSTGNASAYAFFTPEVLQCARRRLDLEGALRLRTVAEGIETVAQYRLLASQGCREGQGYLFAKPLEASDFVSLLATPSLPRRPELLSGTG